MGLFDFFKKSPSENAILSQVRKAKEPYAQPDYRRMAMDKLLNWDTNESLKGILERFTVVIQSPHWDEEEKRWLVEELVKKGERMVPILREFLLKKNEVNHAILALKQLIKNPKEVEKLLVEALEKRPPSDHRSIQAKRELIAALSELNENQLDNIIAPYIEDHSDDVQCEAIIALAKTQSDAIKQQIAKLLTSDIHSARVLRTAAQVILDTKTPLEDTMELTEVLQEEYAIKDNLLTKLNFNG